MTLKKHVILDTDIGCDPDDLITVLLGFSSAEIQFDMIITSDEFQGYKALFLKEILKKMNLKVLIRSGSSLNRKKYNLMLDSNKKSKLQINDDYLKNIEEIIARNERTYYICIGPQTNIAKFIDFNSSLKMKFELILMGGSLNYRHNGKAEFNIRSDLDSARKVFNSNLHKRYVLSDTAFHTKLAVNENHTLFKIIKNSNCKSKDLIISNFRRFFSKFYPYSYMQDPLAFSYILEPEFISFSEEKLMMDSKGRFIPYDKGKSTLISVNAQHSKFMKCLEYRLRNFLS